MSARKRIRLTDEQRVKLIDDVEVRRLPYKVIADEFGWTARHASDKYHECRKMMENGYLVRPESKKTAKPKPKSVEAKTDRIMGQLAPVMERFGYNPAEGLIAYRMLLKEMADMRVEEAKALTLASNLRNELFSRRVMEGEDALSEAAKEVLSLMQQGVAIDEKMMGYVFPKLTSSTIRIKEEEPPLLIIGDPEDEQ